MIVITSLCERPRKVLAGDEYQLRVTDATGCEVIIRETIAVDKTIDFVASFRFALENGTCPGFHLTGVFACKAELPLELKNAKMLHDLTKEQQANFISSCGTI